MNTNKLSYLFAGLTIIFWGTAATAFKLSLDYFNNMQLLAWASLFSTIILFITLIITGKVNTLKGIPKKELLRSAFLGFTNPFAYYLILFTAYELLPAQVAQPLNFVWPLVLVVLSVPLLGQKLSTRGLLALIVSFMGVVLISSQGKLDIFSQSNPVGVALALFSSSIWALYWILNLKAKQLDPIARLFLNFLFATLMAFALGSFFNGFWDLNTKGILGSIYVGCFEMGITFVLWLKALSLASSTARIGNTIYLVPFLSLMVIHLVLGETIYWTTIAGLGIIVSSILYQQTGAKA
jgi:drug/metabolite transporter (DMT)-like permease